MKYLVVVETGANNYSADVRDLPGCVSIGDTPEEMERMITAAIAFHLEGMAEDGDEIPEGTAYAIEVEVALPHIAKKAG